MSDFHDLAQAAESDPQHADFTTLRQAYLKSEVYRPAKHIMQWKLMQITNTASNFGEVANTCQGILSGNPMDLEARMTLALAQEKKGDQTAADKNHLFAEQMIDAILATGDGKSFETAWKVVAEAEIWVLFKIFGMKPQGQQVRHQRPDGIFDVFEGKIDDRAVTMYFNVTDPVSFIDQMIAGSSG